MESTEITPQDICKKQIKQEDFKYKNGAFFHKSMDKSQIGVAVTVDKITDFIAAGDMDKNELAKRQDEKCKEISQKGLKPFGQNSFERNVTVNKVKDNSFIEKMRNNLMSVGGDLNPVGAIFRSMNDKVRTVEQAIDNLEVESISGVDKIDNEVLKKLIPFTVGTISGGKELGNQFFSNQGIYSETKQENAQALSFKCYEPEESDLGVVVTQKYYRVEVSRTKGHMIVFDWDNITAKAFGMTIKYLLPELLQDKIQSKLNALADAW